MSQVTIYHNPRCSKSRQTLEILQAQGIEPDVREYLKEAPSKEELRLVLTALNLSARDLLRTGEDEYKALSLNDSNLSEEAILDAMIAHPKLIERPIVIKDGQARIGRPPESVLEIL